MKNKEYRKAFYYICDKCGAALDPGEKCTCETEKQKQQKENRGKAA